MRCSRCGNENPETNRFCGMCGELLVPAASAPVTGAVRTGPPTGTIRTGSLPVATPALPHPPAAPAPPASVTQASVPQAPSTQNMSRVAPPRAPAPAVERPVPSISGPSFLGLSQPGPATRSTKSDPQLERGSGNLDYLLEDEEEPKRGWGKILFALVALGLLLGLGYLRWRGQGLEWLTSGPKKPSEVTQTADGSPPADASQAASNPPAAGSGDAASAPVATQPTATTPGAPASSGTDTSTPAPSATTGNPDAAATTSAPATAPAANTPVASAPAAKPALPKATKTPPADSAATDDSTAADTDEEAADPDAKAAPAPKPRAAKPSPAKLADPVTEAENYIYGRGGVRQDCDRGLKMLRPAAEKSNPKAMISLGALYSAGLCTPHDLPTAYRWFALALRKQPDNQAVQTDLQKLWSEMTPPERQLAIKLSQ